MTDAEHFRAFRFALDPTASQRQDLARHVGAARWAFNHALARKAAPVGGRGPFHSTEGITPAAALRVMRGA